MRTIRDAISMALSALLVIFIPACSQEQEEQQARTTVEFEPGDTGKGPAPPRLPGESGPEEITLTVLEDKRCTDRSCMTAPVIGKLQSTLKGLKVVRCDWSTPECKHKFEREGLKYLPAYLFEESITKHPNYRRIARFLQPTPKGKLKALRFPAEFDPKAEICDNQKDDTGNGLVDCQDPGCKKKVICRKEIPRRLEVFAMSQCPYGTKALDSMGEVLDAFKRKIDFRIHYIASAGGDGFKSLHGQPEVDENIRELCAIKHYPKNYKYMEYIWCRNQNIRDKNWRACTGKNGIREDVIYKCSTGEEGKQLLREDIKMAQELGIGASPTWLANNRFEFHAIPPETIKQNFCKHNKGLKGCEKKLSSKSTVPHGVCK